MWIVVAAALAQDYRLPIGDADVSTAYPTAYLDHGGVDWACGSVRYDGHHGTDFGVGSWAGMDAGREVVAAAPGVVTATHDGEPDRCDTGACGSIVYGNHVWITHADGKSTVYGHMKNGSVAVQVGQSVQCGDHLGQVGSSGWSTGPHLHFGVWRPDLDAFVDPFYGDCSGAPTYWTDQGDYQGVPGTACDAPDACAPVATLRCGDHWEGTNAGTDTHAYWGSCSEFDEYTGDEVAFTLDAWPGDVTVAMTGLTADLDLFVLRSAQCAALDCEAASTEGDTSDEQVTVTSDGAPLTVVVDGFREAGSAFALDVTCTGSPPDTGDSAPDARDGCGCGGGPASSGWAVALVALLGVARRRRHEPPRSRVV